MLRAIREIQPRFVVGENVSGLISWNGGMVFDEVQADLEAAGYEVIPFVLPACGVNAPHRRDRVWFVAHRSQRNDIRDFRNKSERSIPEFRNGAVENIYHGCPGEQVAGVAADTGLFGQEIGRIEPMGVEQLREERVAADPESIYERDEWTGQRGCEIKVRRCYLKPTWDEFPTQPPVRGRNDGFPGELDGITVSKHRNESIKAYGNAIVPQVAFQIFKAIEMFTLIEK